MANDLSIPGAAEVLADKDGKPSSTWYRIFAALVSAFNSATRDISDANTNLDTKANKIQTIGASFTFKFPEAETVHVIRNCPIAWSITKSTTIAEVGTATVAININGTPLGGSSNSASTSEDIQAHSSANAVAVGDDITIVFASVSSDCENLCVTLEGTEVMAT